MANIYEAAGIAAIVHAKVSSCMLKHTSLRCRACYSAMQKDDDTTLDIHTIR